MVDPTPSDYNLTYLRERWERDRSSRIFLQLAEEYRRRGLHAEALEVLETGLGFHPGYLAAQVALGRCRLEAGQPEAAVKVLERVLAQDPTQAVATRLLAESWLQLGDEDRAQAAIDRCRLIGIPPSELVGLEQRLAAARRAARDRWAEPSPAFSPPVAASPVPRREESFEETSLPWRDAEPAEVAEPAPRATAAQVAKPAEVSEAATPTVSDEWREEAPAPAEMPPPPVPSSSPFASEPTAASSPRAAALVANEVFRMPLGTRPPIVLPLRPGVERRLAGARAVDPFGRLTPARQRPASADEIFRLLPPLPPEPPSTPAPAPADTAAPTPAAAPSPPAFPTAAPEPPAPVAPVHAARWWESPAAPAAATAPPAPVAAPPPAPPPASASVAPAAAAATPTPAAARPLAPARWWERPAEPAAPPEPTATPAAPEAAAPTPPPAPAAAASPTAAPPPAPLAAAPPRAAATPSPLAGTAGVELQASGTLEVPELRPSDPGTATLGELYLRQGYVREAEEIFKQVLARDPDNEAALSGLEAIGRRRAQKLTAAELVGGEPEPEVRGLTARKMQLLSRYLRKLRGGERGAGPDVPGTAQ